MLEVFDNKRVLMLQGPAGPFFWRVAKHLRARGAAVTKVNFNAGDDSFFPGPAVVRYRGKAAEWPDFFEELVRRTAMERVVLFGDCRPMHRAAIQRAHGINVEVYVFEEGYLRPDFVTLERGGVNGYSSVPKVPEFYQDLMPTALPTPPPVGNVLPRAAAFAVAYAVANSVAHRLYPDYHHHRDISPLRQARLWFQGGVRRALHGFRDRDLDTRIAAGDLSPFFFLPLQVHFDTQMRHSPFAGIGEFLRTVVRSFARHAPSDTSLLIKDHPLGRPYKDYSSLLRQLRNRYDLGARLVYADLLNLPKTLRTARGTIVINSTVGLSSIHHATPVKCLGTAVYDIPGLTFQGPLDQFWTTQGAVDRRLYARFRWWLRQTNQIPGCVWADLSLHAERQ